MRKARGFTVLEMIVVIGSAGVLAALSAPRLTAWLPDWRLDAAARQVVLDLRVARARAMAEQRARRILFAAIGDTYRRQQRVGSVYTDDGPPVALPRGVDLLDCSAAQEAIAFTPRGTSSSFGTVTLRNAHGRERQIVVDIVGRVRVQ
jgi:Tfp pilus assembly protein FimT